MLCLRICGRYCTASKGCSRSSTAAAVLVWTRIIGLLPPIPRDQTGSRDSSYLSVVSIVDLWYHTSYVFRAPYFHVAHIKPPPTTEPDRTGPSSKQTTGACSRSAQLARRPCDGPERASQRCSGHSDNMRVRLMAQSASDAQLTASAAAATAVLLSVFGTFKRQPIAPLATSAALNSGIVAATFFSEMLSAVAGACIDRHGIRRRPRVRCEPATSDMYWQRPVRETKSSARSGNGERECVFSPT